MAKVLKTIQNLVKLCLVNRFSKEYDASGISRFNINKNVQTITYFYRATFFKKFL